MKPRTRARNGSIAGFGRRRLRVGPAALLLTLASISACAQEPRAEPPFPAASAVASAPEAAKTKTVLIPIEGMSCASCAGRVKKALTGIDGVVEVEVRLADRDAVVRYVEGKTTPERLASAVAEVGYEVGAPKPRER